VAPAGHMFFADHHRYTLEDVRATEQAARRVGAKVLLTTEKDFYNLTGVTLPTLPVYVAAIDLRIDGETAFLSAIGHLLQARGAQA
jgi:tetraacyldisaccharide-1-P 4'-kinase